MYKGMTLGANVVDEKSTATAAGTPPESPGSIDVCRDLSNLLKRQLRI